MANNMGPDVLWLVESLSEVFDFRPGMRVLDLGCGKALSSIFLAREFGVQVWATDLWIAASDNWQRIAEAGCGESVYPIHAEAHDLPFAEGFFDAIVSFDAYHYFGTDDRYLGRYCAPLVKAGGQIGIVVPGIDHEFAGDPPQHLAPHWAQYWDHWTFHSPAWWRRHWEKTGLVSIDVADVVDGGWRRWIEWDEALLEVGHVPDEEVADAKQWIETMRIDAGRNLGFARIVARKS